MPGSVGFIGLGTMGMPMVTNLARAGVPLVVYDAQPEVTARACELPGVAGAASPKEVAGRCDVLFTCLPNDAIVEQVYRGEEGLLQAAREGLVTCDCSTVSPEVTVSLQQTLGAAGAIHMDTPMLGSQPQAQSGDIFFIVGGEEGAVERISPYLAIMGKMHIHVGSSGTANKIKLIHNALAGVYYAAGAEALALCRASGVALPVFHEVVLNGGGIAFSNYFVRKVPSIIEGDYAPRFKLALELKDLMLAKQFSEQVGVPTPIMDEVRATYQEAHDDGHGELDSSAVNRVIEKRTGLTIGKK